eukprot:2530648-Pyramimonas_sp.AAC.1
MLFQNVSVGDWAIEDRMQFGVEELGTLATRGGRSLASRPRGPRGLRHQALGGGRTRRARAHRGAHRAERAAAARCPGGRLQRA